MVAEKTNTRSNLLVGTGYSTDKDSVKAAVEAAKMSLSFLRGKAPTISYIFFAGDYDVEKLNKGLVSILGGTEFIGGSADAVYFETKMFRKGIVVASIQSDFLHVGIASVDKVSKNPRDAARKAVSSALEKLSIDKYVDPYLQFTRMKNANVKWMVKIPSFFVFAFSRGMKLPQMGEEMKIINGISDEIGLDVPIYGGSFGVELEKLFTGKPYEIYSLHSGKILRDGLIVSVNVCSHVYGMSMAHGAKRTDKFGYISSVSNDGYVVTGISGKNPVDWYANQIGISREKFLKNHMELTQLKPLGIPDIYGNYIIRAGGVPNNNNMAFTAPFVEGWPVYLMDASPKNVLDAPAEVSKDIMDYTSEKGSASFCLAVLCASCRVVLKDNVVEDLKILKKKFNAPIIGFSSFGEIGSKTGAGTGFQHLNANIFVIYSKMLHEISK